MKLSPVVKKYYYERTNDILLPELAINYYYVNYLFDK